MDNLLFDLIAIQPNASGKRHGGGKYGEIIFFRLIKSGISFSCFYDSSKWINPLVLESCISNNVLLFDIQIISIDNILTSLGNNPVVYSALPFGLPKMGNVRIIGTIHGVRDLELPLDLYQLYYKNTVKEYLIFFFRFFFHKYWFTKKIRNIHNLLKNEKFSFFTVSNHSKYAILSFFPEIKEQSIKVFYSPSTSSLTLKIERVKKTYFLLVSGNRWEKNNLRAIIALDQLFTEQRMTNFSVIVTGMNKNSVKYKIKNCDNFDFIGYIDDKELEILYANAYALIYPSFSEGFGYPPLEAMRYGVPVLASSFTSIPEICVNAAIYFNPYSISEIKARILMILSEVTYNECSVNSMKRYKEVHDRQDIDLELLINYLVGTQLVVK